MTHCKTNEAGDIQSIETPDSVYQIDSHRIEDETIYIEAHVVNRGHRYPVSIEHTLGEDGYAITNEIEEEDHIDQDLDFIVQVFADHYGVEMNK